MWRKLTKEASEILADIRAGDIMTALFAFFSVLVLGAIVYIAKWNVYVGIIFLCLFPFSVIFLTIFYKWIISRFATDLNWLSEDQKTKDELKVRHLKFIRRFYHAEYRVNANADAVNNFLLQYYAGIPIYNEQGNVTYIKEEIKAFDPKQGETFQYGFIAGGIKSTAIHGYYTVAGMKVTDNPIYELIPEMFFVTISQGAKNVAIVAFDADTKAIASFSQGLLSELRKGFSVKIIYKMRNQVS